MIELTTNTDAVLPLTPVDNSDALPVTTAQTLTEVRIHPAGSDSYLATSPALTHRLNGSHDVEIASGDLDFLGTATIRVTIMDCFDHEFDVVLVSKLTNAQSAKLDFSGTGGALKSESTNALPATSYTAPLDATQSQAAAAAAIVAASLPTVSQLNARTKLAAEYFDPAVHYVSIAVNGLSGEALSSAAVAKIESALLDEEDGVAFKDALMTLIADQLDTNDLTAMTIATAVVGQLFAALVADHNSSPNTWGERLARIPNAAPGSSGGLPTVDASNRIAGIQGTLNSFDDLDTAQDAQHTATHNAVAALQDLSQAEVQAVLTALGYTAQLATDLGTTNSRVDDAITSRAAPGAAMTLTTGERTSIAGTIWSTLVSSISTANSIGKLILDRVATLLRLDGMIENSSGDQFTQKALNKAPSNVAGDTTVIFNPAISNASPGSVQRQPLTYYTREGKRVQLTIYDGSGSPVDMRNKELRFVVENRNKQQVFVKDMNAIDISGEDFNQVWVTISSEDTGTIGRVYNYALRDIDDDNFLWATESFTISYAPSS